MAERERHRHRYTYLAIALAVAFALWLGWREFWFLTDDAFIAFRYVSNSLAGRGYVWNPEPFRPVDGYTSFLWVALLDGCWRVTGLAPPKTANVLGLGFAGLQLALTFRMLLELPLSKRLVRFRPALLSAGLIAVITNRTFLAWTSSGLETAMFNFVVVAWVYVAVFRRSATARFCGELGAAGLFLALTRPDGLLYVAASAAMVVLTFPAIPRPKRRAALLCVGAVIGILGAFLVWRQSTYGALLPNTYYAKVARTWPAAGLRYLASFILEYALWIWAAIVGSALAVVIRRRAKATEGAPDLEAVRTALLRAAPAITILGHIGYYTLVVGGDHFEFRVYSHVIPLLSVVVIWATSVLHLRLRSALGLVGLWVVVSWAVPWTHYIQTRSLSTRRETAVLKHAVAPSFPRPLRWYAQSFDDLQFYLIDKMICMRHQEHRIFYEYKLKMLPDREAGEAIAFEGNPVHLAGEVGVVGWVLPNVAIIDSFGLNDYYIARNRETKTKLMAHSRVPPPGYVSAFRPNVHLVAGEWVVTERATALTANDIVKLQRMYDVWLANQR